MVAVLAGLFMGCPTLLSPSMCYVMLEERYANISILKTIRSLIGPESV